MSNIIAGDIFEKIIEEVVQASQTDFEENGVNQQTLLELKQTWQQKLSARGVAQMPWDPKPEPVAQSGARGGVNGHGYGGPSSQGARIKSEPTTDAAFVNPNFMPPAMNPELAQERATHLLAQQYGSQASASISAMQQRGIALPGQQVKGPGGIQLPGTSQQTMQQQYAQQMKQQQAAQQPRIKAETDGASDWDATMDARRATTSQHIAQNDATVRVQILHTAAERETGLLQPRHQRKAKVSSKGKQPAEHKAVDGIPQLDGDYDDVKDEDEENAINSDLDSSGDEVANADEEDEDIDSMLCTYDKVQRVKNKWKCVLKDGVLSANGKEYLFHKATGEFEW